MNKFFFTITGTCYRFGQDFLEPGTTGTVREREESSNSSTHAIVLETNIQ